MRVFRHQVLRCAPFAAPAVARRLLAPPAAAGKAPLFGVFTPQIGLSLNHVVLLAAFADAAAAAAFMPDAGADVAIERDELWMPAPRPSEDEAIAETDGIFSHRWFDCADADWPRFQELSVSAWDNFEDAHDTRVIGFWRSLSPPAAGVTRVWLMAWYRDLGTWEASRWWHDKASPAAAAAHERFRARRAITLDSAVSILGRVT